MTLRGLHFREAQNLLRVSERTLRRWLQWGVIRFTKKKNTIFVNREDVEKIVKAETSDEEAEEK